VQGESQLSKENLDAPQDEAASRVSHAAESSPLPEKVRDSSTVIAEAAHELRLPIANIKLLVETLLDGALDEREVCKRMLKRAYQEVERLQALVNDLLALEQVAEKRHELQCEWLSLRERALYAIETVAKQAFEKGIKISVEAKHEQIYANRGQLDQVLLNLLENAVKFTPQNGKIFIRPGASEGCFSIEDTGIGMPAAEIPKIFSRFYRISHTKGGTGLGLSIVKQVLDLHGAKISVKSTEGVGSCFELEFPSPNAITTRSQAGG
jgi:two-component system phosphate regulon sensor histidine kinase PhoR